MTKSLRVLMVEDSPTDAKLVLRELRRSGSLLVHERVEDAVSMRAALAEGTWDVIICDWSMPRFTAPLALDVLRESGHDIPFIIVSGTIGEETAVEAMRAGAQDYVVKDKLARLAPAIEREVRECAERTAHREAERALRQSEARFLRLAQSGVIGISVGDASGNLIEANDAFLSMVGYSKEDVVAGRVRWAELTPPELRHQSAIAGEQLKARGFAGPWEKEYVRKDGGRVPVLVGLAGLEGAETISFAIDLSEQKRTQAALRASEVRLSRLADSGIVGIAVVDLFGETYEANDAYLAMIGCTREDLLAGEVRWTSMTPPEWRDLDGRAVSRLTAHGSVSPWEKEYIRKDGRRVRVLQGVAMLDHPKCIVIMADLTERERVEATLRETENQLRQAQKMEAVGALAGGVAHDFNNMLSVILSYGQLLLSDLKAGDPMRSDIEEICRAGNRAADLTRQLLMFSRQQVMQPRVLDLNDVLMSMEKMLRRIVGEDVELVSLPSRSLGKIRVDPGGIEQVIMNLVVNARDAMPTGGKLTMETADVILDEEYARGHLGVSAGAHVMLAVSDTGVGMDRRTQARIFEPFFTTKDRGKGTGLGLSTVFGIVRQSSGSIWVYSELGKGTTFKIYLPRVDGVVESVRPRVHSSVPPGAGTILLVEDEAQVRAVARGILRRSGYHVLDAGSATEALWHCEKHVGTIHLMVTDVVMPLMSGPDLAKSVAQIRPEMKLLYMSGYTDDSVVRHGVLEGGGAFLQKPFTPESLTRKVREVLTLGSALR